MLETIRVLKEADQKGIQLPLLKATPLRSCSTSLPPRTAFPLSLPWTSWGRRSVPGDQNPCMCG